LETNEPSTRAEGRSPSLAALLSFIWPGLGQLYVGNRRLAALFLAPTILLVAIVGYQLRQGVVVFGARFADPEYCLGALVIVILIAVWRLAAVANAFLTGQRRPDRRILDRLVVAALVAIVVVTHGFSGVLLATAYSATSNVFSSDNGLIGGDLATPIPTPTPIGTVGPTASPTPVPTESPSGRVTMFFAGVDSAAGRGTSSYDSEMVVTFNPTANTVQMVSIPREIAGFPMYYGGKDPLSDWITYLPNYLRIGHGASGPRSKSPDSPFMTLVNEVQYLVGVHIDYWAVMDLNGFPKMVDALGGIDVVSPYVINDPSYDWLDQKHFGVIIGSGPQHLNGAYALAYARSRHGGGNDYKRAARQQQVMMALLAKMAKPGAIFQLNNLIAQVGSSVQTGSTNPAKPFRPTMVADYVAAAEGVPTQSYTQIVLGPPYTKSVPMSLSRGKASICMSMPMVAAESIKLFGKDSLYYGKPTPANVCP
jgi:LCP family protein required for cell wall assembly